MFVPVYEGTRRIALYIPSGKPTTGEGETEIGNGKVESGSV